MKPKMIQLYPDIDPMTLEHHYHRHVNGMTREDLNSKADIAVQLAWRDQQIEKLEAALANTRALLAELSELYRVEHEQIAPLLRAAAAALDDRCNIREDGRRCERLAGHTGNCDFVGERFSG